MEGKWHSSRSDHSSHNDGDCRDSNEAVLQPILLFVQFPFFTVYNTFNASDSILYHIHICVYVKFVIPVSTYSVFSLLFVLPT